MKILIVDDNREDRRVLRYMIERNGHEAIEAVDGADGLEKAKSRKPDLIISDALMPVMDGFQFLREVKQDTSLRSIPFVFYSSSYKESQDVRLAMSLGADTYIIKPVDPVELWEKIEDMLTSEKKGKAPPVPLIGEDAEYLRQYSNVVANKLEKKVHDLEMALEDRKRAEEALRRSETELAAIYDNAPLMMMLIDDDRRVLKANRAVIQNAGRKMEDIIGLRGGDILKCLHVLDDPNGCGFGFHCSSCGLRDAIATALHTKQSVYRREATILTDREANLSLHVLVSTVLLELHGQSAVLVCIEDITERIKLEKQLLHAQKMEAIGTLAGGIAHDFNNILTAIIGFGSLLKQRLAQDNTARNYVDDILAASERASKLTHSLLAFGRKQIITFRPQDLNEIVKGFEKFISRIIGEDIELRVLLTEERLTVMADSGQMEQVLMNLVTNARDAMAGGGVLTIETERVHVGEEPEGLTIPGDYAMMSISDTGEGMSEETRQRIFEPFFTTKEVGKGTGLGMSIVYGIIKQHDGEISVYSKPGAGTTFKIYLRLVDTGAEHGSAAPSSAPKRGSETILVAEDDNQVRRLCRTILEGYGYTVIEAVDGADAVARFIENKDKIQLLLLDIIMPKKSGKETYEEIKKMAKDIRVIFSSGYTADIIHQKGLLEEGIPLLLKPVLPDTLLAKVREVLDK